MKKIIVKYLVIIPFVCVMILYGPSVYGQNARSDANVNFEAGTGPVSPVDPDDLDDLPVDPEDPDAPKPVAGPFAIVSVSNFDFGTLYVSTTETLRDVTLDRPNIQVVDLRGAATGWTVKAKASSFTTVINDATVESLKGAEIHITQGEPNSESISPSPVQQSVVLTADGEYAPVVTADSEAGVGLWVMRWYSEATGAKYVQLYVPPGVGTKGDHTATINWTLEDAPNE